MLQRVTEGGTQSELRVSGRWKQSERESFWRESGRARKEGRLVSYVQQGLPLSTQAGLAWPGRTGKGCRGKKG